MPSIQELLAMGGQYVKDAMPGGVLSSELPGGPTKSVMSGYKPYVPPQGPGPQPYVNTEEPLGPPSIGPVSLDPTDYIGPGTLTKAAAGIKALLGSGAGVALGGVMKPRGGQWMNDSVEQSVKSLLSPEHSVGMNRTPSVHQPVNDWIRGPMTKYLRERFASPQDEVRLLADKTAAEAAATKTKAYTEVAKLRDPARASLMRSEADDAEKEALEFALHTPSSRLWIRNNNIVEHQNAARHEELGQTPVGRTWESSADSQVLGTPADQVDPSVAAKMPWLSKVEPDTPIYSMSTMKPMGDTGLSHLTDELRNAINPSSDVPAHLKITPEILKNMSMEKAVRHVAALNKWRADTVGKIAPELQAKQTIVHDFAGMDNPQGWHVRQLENEGDFAAEGKAMAHSVGGYEPESLGGSVEYGHGGWPAIKNGTAEVYSVRNAKGKPAVTIEVGPPDMETLMASEDPRILGLFEDALDRVYAMEARNGSPIDETGDSSAAAYNLMRQLPEFRNQRVVTQVQGKRNTAVTPDVLPFVQDFIKNPANKKQFTRVEYGVLEDLDMIALEDMSGPIVKKLEAKYPGQKYFTNAEVDAAYGKKKNAK